MYNVPSNPDGLGFCSCHCSSNGINGESWARLPPMISWKPIVTGRMLMCCVFYFLIILIHLLKTKIYNPTVKCNLNACEPIDKNSKVKIFLKKILKKQRLVILNWNFAKILIWHVWSQKWYFHCRDILQSSLYIFFWFTARFWWTQNSMDGSKWSFIHQILFINGFLRYFLWENFVLR